VGFAGKSTSRQRLERRRADWHIVRRGDDRRLHVIHYGVELPKVRLKVLADIAEENRVWVEGIGLSGPQVN